MKKIIFTCLMLATLTCAEKLILINDSCIIGYDTRTHKVSPDDRCFNTFLGSLKGFSINCLNYEAKKQGDVASVHIIVRNDSTENYIQAMDVNNNPISYNFVSFSKDMNNGLFDKKNGACYLMKPLEIFSPEELNGILK